MFEKIAIKNPGCSYCRYYIPQFEHNGKLTIEACLKNARKIFQQNQPQGKKRKWKWNGCEYASERNKNRLCRDFQIQSFLFKIHQKLSLISHKAGEQYPPTFSGEIWWEP